MEFWRGIETFPAVEALKVSFVVYPLVSAVHIAAIGIVFSIVMLMDLAVLLPRRHAARTPHILDLRPVALGAFGIAVLSGVVLFVVNAADYAINPAFRLKLLLILATLANLLAFERASGWMRRACAAVSMMLWTGVLVCGRFIGFL